MEKNKNILEEAVKQRDQLLEAAKNTAKEKLATEMAEQFNKILNEELVKINTNKESLNESKDSDDENDTKDTETEVKDDEKSDDEKESNNDIIENVDLTQTTIDEVEKEFDNASQNDQFDVQNDIIDLDALGKELENLENIEATSEVPTEDNVEQNAGELEQSTEPQIEEDVNDPYVRMKNLMTEFNNIIADMDNTKKDNELTSKFDGQMQEAYGENFKDSLGEKYNELKEMFISHQKGEPYGESKVVNESDDVVVDNADEKIAEADVVDGEETIDEVHGVGISQQKTVSGNQLPRPENATYKKGKVRYALQKESWEKKLKSQISENKKLTKKNNEMNADLNKSKNLVREYNEVLKKYRTQLNEMALFNTNLSHTNNLLVNEEISLTGEDKVTVINNFKKVLDINESEQVYNSLLKGFKEIKKPIVENVEKKLTENINSSSKNKLDESINEKTAFSSNKHLDKIKNVVKYIEKNK